MLCYCLFLLYDLPFRLRHLHVKLVKSDLSKMTQRYIISVDLVFVMPENITLLSDRLCYSIIASNSTR